MLLMIVRLGLKENSKNLLRLVNGMVLGEKEGQGVEFINIYVYIYIMSHLINVSDEVYEELTKLKKIRNDSYSSVLKDVLKKNSQLKKTIGWEEMIQKAKERDAQYKGKKEKIDHDLIAYGVSRDSS